MNPAGHSWLWLKKLAKRLISRCLHILLYFNPVVGYEKSTSNATQKSKEQDSQPDRSSDPVSLADDIPIAGWTDMKQFDDDHDPDWFDEEETRLGMLILQIQHIRFAYV